MDGCDYRPSPGSVAGQCADANWCARHGIMCGDVTVFSWKTPVRPSSAGRFTRWEKARLAAEIVGQYLPLLRSLRRDGLATVLEEARHPRCVRVAIAPEEEHETARRLGSVVEQVLGPLPTDNRCLIRSLVLVRILARRSVDARLVIGVRLDDEFAAHAWVEHDEQPLLPTGCFEPLQRL